jgi:hypothetical protein
VVTALLQQLSHPYPSTKTQNPLPTSGNRHGRDISPQQAVYLPPTSSTAFTVGPRTLVTNAQVVDHDAKPTVLSRDGGTSVRAVVGGVGAELDAVLVTDHDLPGGSLTWVGPDDLTEGQSLVALGCPVPDHNFTVT